jgi:hypothetical protein
VAPAASYEHPPTFVIGGRTGVPRIWVASVALNKVQASNSTGRGSEVAADCAGWDGVAGDGTLLLPQAAGKRKMSKATVAQKILMYVSPKFSFWCFVVPKFMKSAP